MIVACQVMDPGSIPGERMFFFSLSSISYERQRVRVVKEVDSKSTGLCPREFKSRRCRIFFSPLNRHRVRVVKELVLKANGLCPREFKSRRCRLTFFVSVHTMVL